MAGTVTTTHQDGCGHVREIKLACVADVAAATIPATALPKFNGKLIKVVTDPGATAPTASWDLTLVNQHGVDVLDSRCLNRSDTNTEQVDLVDHVESSRLCVGYGDTLTATFANNAVNSAIIDVYFYYTLGVTV